MRSESDSVKPTDMKAWEKTEQVGENVKDGIELAPLVMPRDYYADEGDYDGAGKAPGKVDTNITWKDIKNTADAVFEPAVEYPGIHSAMNQVYESGLSELEQTLYDAFADGTKTTKNSKPFSDEKSIDSGVLEPQHTLYNAFANGPDGSHLENDKKLPDMDEKVFGSGSLEPQHTLYDAFAVGTPIEDSKEFPGVMNIPKAVKRDENNSDISDEDLESSGSVPSDTALPSEEIMESVKRELDKIHLSEQNMVAAKRDLDKLLHSDDVKCNISKDQTSDEDSSSTSSDVTIPPDISENTFQKMESVKTDLNKILNSVKKKSKDSKEIGEDNRSANEPKEVSVKGITKSVKEIKQKCRSASEKLAEFLE